MPDQKIATSYKIRPHSPFIIADPYQAYSNRTGHQPKDLTDWLFMGTAPTYWFATFRHRYNDEILLYVDPADVIAP